MKRDKLSIIVLALELATIIFLHSAKTTAQPGSGKTLVSKGTLKQTELQMASQTVFKVLKKVPQ